MAFLVGFIDVTIGAGTVVVVGALVRFRCTGTDTGGFTAEGNIPVGVGDVVDENCGGDVMVNVVGHGEEDAVTRIEFGLVGVSVGAVLGIGVTL